MKRLFLVLVGASLVCTMHAQVLEQDEPALVYFSPKNTVVLDFTYTIEKQERGIYADYAKKMLGIQDAVQETKSVYSIQDVHIGLSTETDYSRPHKISLENDLLSQWVSINEKGLLLGYNVSPKEKSNVKKPNKPCERRCIPSSPTVAPLGEDALENVLLKEQAQAVVKQILGLRETRMFLLSGEVEHVPADGESMKQMLAALDKQEQALTELFTGKKCKNTEHKIVRVTPDILAADENGIQEQTGFFSPGNGFTDGENVDADSIKIVMCLHRPVIQKPVVTKKHKKKKAPEVSQIVYNLPGNADIQVEWDGRILAQRTMPIAQLGVDVPLAKSLFTGAELPHIVFSEKSGNIVSISK